MIGQERFEIGGGWRRPWPRNRPAWAPALWVLRLLTAMVLIFAAAPIAAAMPAQAPLVDRQAQWPEWTLPAPLQRPGRRDLLLPSWMLGSWTLQEVDPDGPSNSTIPDQATALDEPVTGPSTRLPSTPAALTPVITPGVSVRFLETRRGQVVGDRAFNALAIGRSVLGDSLLRVDNDPENPNRQLARLRDDRLLESTVIGRASVTLDPDTFLADELTLQILHGPGQPQISQVEVLARYHRLENSVAIEQWQASYGSPGDSGGARRSSHQRMVLRRSSAEG